MLRFADALPMVKTLPVVACLGHAGEKRGKGQLAWTLAVFLWVLEIDVLEQVGSPT